MSKMKRWSALLLAVLMMVSILAGCGSKNGSGEKDTFIVAMRTDFVTFDPAKATATLNQAGLRVMYDPLVDIDQDGSVIPAVAESWEVVDNGAAYVFNIRQGIKFHNGDPLTAEDVAFEIQRESDAAARATINVDSVEILGDYQVKVTMKEPDSLLLKELAMLLIPSKKAVEAAGDSYNEAPVGSGPYSFVSYSPSDMTTFTRFDEYWGDAAKIKNITFRYIPDNTTRALSLETGEVDYIVPMSAEDYETIKSNSDCVAVADGGGMQYYLGFNLSNEYLSNKLVRQAISYAVDRSSIASGAFESTATPAYLPVASNEFGYTTEISYPEFNIEKAKELMKQAGMENGFSCNIVTTAGVSAKACEILQAALKQINIDLSIQQLEFSAYLDAWITGNFDIMMDGWTNNLLDAHDFFYNVLTTTSDNNVYGYSNEKVDTLVQEAVTAGTDEERQAYYNELYNIIIDECPIVPVVFSGVVYGYRSNVKDLYENAMFWVNYADISFAS